MSLPRHPRWFMPIRCSRRRLAFSRRSWRCRAWVRTCMHACVEMCIAENGCGHGGAHSLPLRHISPNPHPHPSPSPSPSPFTLTLTLTSHPHRSPSHPSPTPSPSHITLAQVRTWGPHSSYQAHTQLRRMMSLTTTISAISMRAVLPLASTRLAWTSAMLACTTRGYCTLAAAIHCQRRRSHRCRRAPCSTSPSATPMRMRWPSVMRRRTR